MPCRRLGLALLVLVLGAWPAAADVGALLGKRIVDVRVDAGGVAVTDPNVLTLVETRLGDALTMAGVRQTIEHFVTLGRYADVRVFGEPDGADAVRLRYEVVPVERVTRLEFQGPAGLDARALRSDLTDRFGALPLASRLPEMAQEIVVRYQARGYPAARVETRTTPEGRDGTVAATFVITPGRQTVVGAISVEGPASATRGLAARLGLVTGRPLDADTLVTRVDEAEDDLKRDGFYEAIVTAQVTGPPEGGADVAVRVNLGDRVEIAFAGDPLPADRRRDLVPIDRLRSVEEEVVEDGSRNLEQYLRLEGYRAASAPATRQRAGGVLRITFEVARGPLHVLGRVDTTGVALLPRAELEPLLKLQPGEPYVDARIAAVGAALAEHYRVRGFASVLVSPQVTFPGGTDPARVPVDVRFQIAEGPRTMVTGVRIDGASALSEAELAGGLGLSVGKPFYQPQQEIDRDAVERRYRNAGFQRASVEARPLPSDDRGGVTVTYVVREGPQTRVDHILVAGTERTSPDLVRREITLQPGGPLGYDAIIESQQRLSALGLFRRVRITEAPHGIDDTARDVLVELEEAPSTSASYGGGLEVGQRTRRTEADTATDRLEIAPRGFFEITRRNLWGKNRSISLLTSVSVRPTDPGVDEGPDAEGGYGLNQYRVVGTFREPRPFNTRGDAQFSAFLERGIRSSFDFDRRGVRAEYARRFANRLVVLGRYSYDFTEIFGRDIAAENQLLVDRLFPQVRLSTMFASVIRDSRDDVLDPVRGTVLGGDVDVALPALGSEVGFTKGFVQTFVYKRLPGSRAWVVAAGARLGAARGFEKRVPRLDTEGQPVLGPDGTPVVDVVSDLPASERFFTGGDSTVRGFALDRLGSQSTLNADGFPTGGNALVVLNAELRTPPVKGVGLVGFVDAGNVFLRAGDVALSELRTAAGFGIRYRSPLGPLRFDIGFKLDRRDFSRGTERRAVYHLSLGQAF
jgi:outer membrane protein insertion porin family